MSFHAVFWSKRRAKQIANQRADNIFSVSQWEMALYRTLPDPTFQTHKSRVGSGYEIRNKHAVPAVDSSRLHFTITYFSNWWFFDWQLICHWMGSHAFRSIVNCTIFILIVTKFHRSLFFLKWRYSKLAGDKASCHSILSAIIFVISNQTHA